MSKVVTRAAVLIVGERKRLRIKAGLQTSLATSLQDLQLTQIDSDAITFNLNTTSLNAKTGRTV